MTRISLRKLKKYYGLCNYCRSIFNSERFLRENRINRTLESAADEDETLILNVFSVTRKYKPETLRKCAKRCADNNSTDSKSTRSYIPLRDIPRERYNLRGFTVRELWSWEVTYEKYNSS